MIRRQVNTERLLSVPALQAASAVSGAFSAEYLEFQSLCPVDEAGRSVRIATWLDAVDVQALDEILNIVSEAADYAVGRELELVHADENETRETIRRLYGNDRTAKEFIAGLGHLEPSAATEIALDDLVARANEAPVIKLVNLLLLEALEARASDVHMEWYARGVRVRYRIDGVLQDAPSPPAHLAAAIVSRLKVMADLDIAERRLPQDGRIRLQLSDRYVDVRVSTLPTLHGESVVLRLLDKEKGRIGLADVGMSDEMLAQFSRVLKRPHGVVLATGPTGSGKTTTLYAAMDLVRSGREKILTVEDPVEYELTGVPQVAVNERIGLTFATALRALLRQDPDVMLVGEIRDAETAEIATQAALTGHLILSTLHTNDAVSALTRLLELGMAPYLVASTVEGVLAQRLVRLLCEDCREPVTSAIPNDGDSATKLPQWRAVGCPSCRGTGFRGRTGIYELLVVDDAIREEVLQRRGAVELRRIATSSGMRTLRDDGMRLVREGRTTLEEVVRVTTD